MCHLSEAGKSGLNGDWRSGKTGSGRRGSEGVWRRRGWVPQPVGRGNPAPTIADISVTGDSILPLAPAERYVYRRAICPKPCAPAEHYVGVEAESGCSSD